MKKILFLVAGIFLSLQSLGQKDTLKISAGFMLVPNAGISLNSDFNGFQANPSLFGIMSVVKGNTFITPFYSLSANAFGIAILQQVNSSLSLYAVVNNSVLKNGGYAGSGIGVPVSNGKATAFIEVGSSWNKWSPGFYTGLFIPFTKKIK